MPEGPEIPPRCAGIDKVLSGRQAEIVSFGQAHLQRFGQHLSGERIDWVSSRGKAMLTRFANGLTSIATTNFTGVGMLCVAIRCHALSAPFESPFIPKHTVRPLQLPQILKC